MNHPAALFVGALATVLLSLCGLVFVPNWQLRDMAPLEISDASGAAKIYPQPLDPDLQGPGQRVYIAQGCIYCHSQQVRPDNRGNDTDRGWGERRSVPRDYLLQSPPLLGTMRTGPDLANIGARQPDDTWHHLHLYDARLVSPGSIMPPFRYLYSRVDANPGSTGYALPPAAGSPAPAGYIVPSLQARQLVAYLQQLQQPYSLEQVQ